MGKYADEGSENAKIFMAYILLHGWGVVQDVRKVEEIFMGLSKNGNPYAQFMMMQMCLASVTESVKKDVVSIMQGIMQGNFARRTNIPQSSEDFYQ